MRRFPSFIVRTKASKELLERILGRKLEPVKTCFPVRNELVKIEPMKRSPGKLFFLSFKYGGDR